MAPAALAYTRQGHLLEGVVLEGGSCSAPSGALGNHVPPAPQQPLRRDAFCLPCRTNWLQPTAGGMRTDGTESSTAAAWHVCRQ